MLVYNLGYRLLQNGQRIVPGALFNTIALESPTIARKYGLEAVQTFPMTLSQSGTAPNGDGYGKQYDGRLSPSRFAQNDAEILRGVACAHACGLAVGSDEVTHQYDGSNRIKGTDILYPEFGEGMRLGEGDFNKHDWGFVGAPPRSAVDPVFDAEGNFGFGDMTSLISSGHDGYMLAGMCRTLARRAAYVDWDFWRHDDAKGTAVAATNALINAIPRKYGYAEVFKGYIPELQAWFQQTGSRLGLLDFPLHWSLVGACNGYNAHALAETCLCHTNPLQAWKFRDNGDTDTNPGQAVISNGLIANIRLLTAPGGNSLLYAKDYLPYDQGGYNLSAHLINYVWIARNLASGAEALRLGNDNAVAVFERMGGPGLITCYNLDTYNNRTITFQTNFGPNVDLWEYSGALQHRFGYSSVRTDGNGRLTLTVPCNAYSRGDNTLCLSRTGYGNPFPKLSPRYTTNVFEAAQNLIIPRATEAGTVPGKIWCAPDTEIELAKPEGDGVRFTVTDATGNVIIDRGQWSGKTKERGYHTITAFSPTSVPAAYKLSATYMATQGITQDDLAAETKPTYASYCERTAAYTEARMAKRRTV